MSVAFHGKKISWNVSLIFNGMSSITWNLFTSLFPKVSCVINKLWQLPKQLLKKKCFMIKQIWEMPNKVKKDFLKDFLNLRDAKSFYESLGEVGLSSFPRLHWPLRKKKKKKCPSWRIILDSCSRKHINPDSVLCLTTKTSFLISYPSPGLHTAHFQFCWGL